MGDDEGMGEEGISYIKLILGQWQKADQDCCGNVPLGVARGSWGARGVPEYPGSTPTLTQCDPPFVNPG